MVTIDEFARRWERLRDFVLADIDRIAKEKASIIEEMQRRRLAKGKNIEGRTMQKGYSPGYEKKRKRKGLQTNYVDLNFTGEFYESLELTETPTPGEFVTVSYVDYAKYIIDRFVGALGLDKGSAAELKTIILKDLQGSVKTYLTA